MKRKKEQWVDEVFGSLNGLERAEPNPFLFAKIENRIQQASARIACVPARTVWLVAASFALLVFLNGQLIRRKVAPSTENSLNSVVSDMQLYPTENQLYSGWSGQNY